MLSNHPRCPPGNQLRDHPHPSAPPVGAVLAFMLGLARFSLEECADMYRRFGSEVFRQNPLVGTVKMGWNHSYYDTEIWETILQ